jgi:hypothetical protein
MPLLFRQHAAFSKPGRACIESLWGIMKFSRICD